MEFQAAISTIPALFLLLFITNLGSLMFQCVQNSAASTVLVCGLGLAGFGGGFGFWSYGLEVKFC